MKPKKIKLLIKLLRNGQLIKLLFNAIRVYVDSKVYKSVGRGNIIKRVLREHYKNVYNALIVKDVVGGGDNHGYIRVGGEKDGAYIMYDDLSNGKVAYSMGIGGNVSWDQDMVDRGYDVFMYDYSIERLPYENPHFHFKQRGIWGKTNEKKNMYAIEDLLKENGHVDNDSIILKMDIEGAEWSVIKYIRHSTLEQFKQIVLELHFPADLSYVYAEPILNKINCTHQVVHIHANNVNSYLAHIDEVSIPMYLEITYLRKRDYEFANSEREFPTVLDAPNVEGEEDIYLGKWNMPIS